jgi:hypothetical protein
MDPLLMAPTLPGPRRARRPQPLLMGAILGLGLAVLVLVGLPRTTGPQGTSPAPRPRVVLPVAEPLPPRARPILEEPDDAEDPETERRPPVIEEPAGDKATPPAAPRRRPKTSDGARGRRAPTDAEGRPGGAGRARSEGQVIDPFETPRP